MKFVYKNINQKESYITPEKYFYNKRKFLKIFGVLGLSSILSSKTSLSFANQILNVKKNKNFINKRPLTDEKYATTYNNYYEFGTGKSHPVERSQKFKTTWHNSIPIEVN